MYFFTGLSTVVLDVDGALTEIEEILGEEDKLEKQFQVHILLPFSCF